jgi:MFS family permease
MIIIYHILSGILSLISAVSPHWIIFMVARVLCGFSVVGGQVPVTLMAEFLPTKIRGVLTLIINVFWTFGALAVSGLAWGMLPTESYTIGSLTVASWRVYMIILSIPLFLAVIGILWVPESARYLTISGRYEEAEAILQWMWKWNRKEPLPGSLEQRNIPVEVTTDKKKSKFFELFAKGMWKITVSLSWISFANSLVYYGVVVMTPQYFSVEGGSTYPAVFLSALAEFPSFVICAVMINWVGRKITMAVNFVCCGICLLCLMIKPAPVWLLTIFAVLSRMFITGSYNSSAAFSREAFPTVIRNSGAGFCISASYVASIVTLFVGTTLLNYSAWACVGVYTSFCIIGAVCSMVVPIEMSGKALSDHIEPLTTEPKPLLAMPSDVPEEIPDYYQQTALAKPSKEIETVI